MDDLKEISLKNPLNLDFQGFDLKTTLQKDAQETQNKKEYSKQKKCLMKVPFETRIKADLEHERLQVKYGLPDHLNYEKVSIDVESSLTGNASIIGQEKLQVKSESGAKQSCLIRTADKKNIIDREEKRLQLKKIKIPELIVAVGGFLKWMISV